MILTLNDANAYYFLCDIKHYKCYLSKHTGSINISFLSKNNFIIQWLGNSGGNGLKNYILLIWLFVVLDMFPINGLLFYYKSYQIHRSFNIPWASLTRVRGHGGCLRKHDAPALSLFHLVSLTRLSVGCGTTPRRQSGYLLGCCLFIRVINTMLPPHGHRRNLYFYKQLPICFLFILCLYKLNFEYVL